MIHEVNFNQSKERIISERSQTIYTEGWFLENFSGKQLETPADTGTVSTTQLTAMWMQVTHKGTISGGAS